MSSSNGEKKSAAFEGQVELAGALEYLKSLHAALKKGTAYVQNGAEVVVLQPEGPVTLTIEAKAKKDKQSIKIGLQWETSEEVPDAESIPFTISDKEPELVSVIEEE
ncbi:MAG: amphi-Trp domain-containing protein [Gemmatimonadota bacterium]|jgi:amphi-Trp domain-containing protein